MQRKYDLNERLINFASDCIDVTERLPKTLAGIHLASQLVRSSTSPALHYVEEQAAESPNDFVHKMKVCLKELRETFNCLLLIKKKNWYNDVAISSLVAENNELVAIFVSSLKTAKQNRR